MQDFEDRTLELKVGIFIAIGILIFFIVVFSIGDVYLVKKGYTIKAKFNFVNGISEGAPVRVAGVDVGQVENIDISYDDTEKRIRVVLTAWINKEDLKIPKDSRVVINTLGLLGEKYLEIFPGTDIVNFLNDGDTIIGYDPIPVGRVTEKLTTLTDNVGVVVRRLKDGKGTIGRLLVDETIYNNLESFTEDIKKHPWKLLHKPRRN